MLKLKTKRKFRRRPPTDISASALTKIIHSAIPEEYTGHSRAQAVEKSITARYEFLSQKARCEEIRKLTEVFAENQRSFDKVIQGVLENQKLMNNTFEQLLGKLSDNSSIQQDVKI